MEFGSQRCNQEQSEAMTAHFSSKNLVEVDTARMYQGGKTEGIIGKFAPNLTKQIVISTKVNPWQPGGMTAEHVLRQANESLTELKSSCVDILYLHAPDHKTPIEETLGAVAQLHKEEKFKRFGLSNYASWQVAEIYYLCKEKGYILPTVYQGMYNVITRHVEGELFPCLRRLNIAFYAYNPLAGGILTNKYKFEDAEDLTEGRFAGAGWAEAYRARFWKRENFEALKLITDALKSAYGEGEGAVTMAQACLRWMMHHSKMKGEHGDALIIGASSMSHCVDNLDSAMAGPLKAEVVAAMDAAWEVTQKVVAVYFR